MENKTEQKKAPVNPLELRSKLLMVLCGVLALALIVVSAFAYQWNDEKKELISQNQGLRAISDPTALSSLSDEIGNLSMVNAQLEAERDSYKKQAEDYKAQLVEAGLIAE